MLYKHLCVGTIAFGATVANASNTTATSAAAAATTSATTAPAATSGATAAPGTSGATTAAATKAAGTAAPQGLAGYTCPTAKITQAGLGAEVGKVAQACGVGVQPVMKGTDMGAIQGGMEAEASKACAAYCFACSDADVCDEEKYPDVMGGMAVNVKGKTGKTEGTHYKMCRYPSGATSTVDGEGLMCKNYKKKAPAAPKPKPANVTVTIPDAAVLKVPIPAVKVTIDFTKVSTPALKQEAATAVAHGVMREACINAAGFATLDECEGGKADGTRGKIYAKFDAKFGDLKAKPELASMVDGYATARRSLAAHATETTNDFKFNIILPRANEAAFKTNLDAQLGKAGVFSEASLAAAIATEWAAQPNAAAMGNATVKFTKPTMSSESMTPGGTTTDTSSAGGVPSALVSLAMVFGAAFAAAVLA